MVCNSACANKEILPYHLGLILIVVANVAFHTEGSMLLYIMMCIIAIFMISFTDLSKYGVAILKEKCVRYLTLVYLMYTFYGILFLRKGTYNWDFMLFSYALNVCLYITLRRIFLLRKWISSLSIPFILSSVIIITYLTIIERDFILVSQVETRVGNSLSGNVNTVGSALGIISFVLTACFSITKRKNVFYVLIPLFFIMLLTGSKKTVIVIVVDVLTIYVYARNKASAFLKFCLTFIVLVWVFLESPYFYEVLGKRMEDMITTMTGMGSGGYSHSTDAREGMILEGFKLFLDYPLFGGGMNYYSYASVKYSCYDYSHCNYTELLCNFGMVGFLLYYFPYVQNVLLLWKTRNLNWKESIFGIMWIVVSLALGWATVQFSDRCINYIPIIASYALIESNKRKCLFDNIMYRL